MVTKPYKVKAVSVQADTLTACWQEVGQALKKLQPPEYRVDHILVVQGLDDRYEATIYVFCELEMRPEGRHNGQVKSQA